MSTLAELQQILRDLDERPSAGLVDRVNQMAKGLSLAGVYWDGAVTRSQGEQRLATMQRKATRVDWLLARADLLEGLGVSYAAEVGEALELLKELDAEGGSIGRVYEPPCFRR